MIQHTVQHTEQHGRPGNQQVATAGQVRIGISATETIDKIYQIHPTHERLHNRLLHKYLLLFLLQLFFHFVTLQYVNRSNHHNLFANMITAKIDNKST